MFVVFGMDMACRLRQASITPIDPPATHSVPVPDQTRMFEHAIFFGPKEGAVDEVAVEQMAPLVILEMTPDQISRAESDYCGVLNPEGYVTCGPMTPTVCFARQSVTIRNVEFSQYLYIWRYPPDFTRGRAMCDSGFDLQITLSTSGTPLVFELFPTSSKYRIVYVSTPLEASAMKEFGQPLLGRNFAIERSTSETPNFVVAGTINDGPMPLGPYIYLSAAPRREIVAVTCRCEKSLAKSFWAEPRYDMKLLESAELGRSSDLEQLLRWPTNMPN